MAAMGMVAIIAKLLWEKGEGESLNSDEIQDLILFIAPTVLALTAWGAYNQVNTGRMLPGVFYVVFQEVHFMNPDNLGAIWDGYLKETSFLNSFQVAISIGVMALGVYYLAKRGGIYGIPLAIFPLALIYVASLLVPFPQAQWTYENRQHLDSILPMLVVLLVLGVATIWDSTVAYIDSQGRLDSQMKGHLQFTLGLAVVFLLGLPLVGAPYLWTRLTKEYSHNVRNVAEVSIPMARWLNLNLREGVQVGTLSPGALRYFSEHDMTDLTGANNAEAIGKPIFEYISESGVDYVVAFDDVYLRSWPGHEEVSYITAGTNTILDGNRLVAYRVTSTTEEADKHQPQTFDALGLRLIDSLDVGDVDEESEHLWRAEPLTDTRHQTFRASADAVVRDEARVTPGYESFRVLSEPGKDLTIVKRYDAVIRGATRVSANGQNVGVWRLPPRPYFFGEDQFVIPGRFIGGGTTLLRFENLTSEGETGMSNLASYYYWVYVPESGNVGSP